ncbi:ATP-binding protein [Streptomyces sp. TRM 70361]|uniref:ATP-binding protein n=1 Tax=Streptomyces sp. TRM 70361 TaxID=3116553 RepID=UPI002E7BA6DE|nr:ATP-binding protein [Streptomyces sp. TRM 70361]MEE1940465.1 ATP-binding protein [Streptomyces sp. TRM 70361]
MGDTSRMASPPSPREKVFQLSGRSVHAAREFVGEVLDDWGVTEREEEVRLCVSELATNAVRHGMPSGDRFRVRLTLPRRGVLRMEVRDRGAGRPCVRRPGLHEEGGRGLLLVDALADAWGVGGRVPGEPGKTVWCEFELKPARESGFESGPAGHGTGRAGPAERDRPSP